MPPLTPFLLAGDVKYQWSVETDETINVKSKAVLLKIPIEDKHTKKNIKVVFKPNHLTVSWGAEGKLDGELSKTIKVDSSTWYIESEKSGRFLILELARQHEDQAWTKIFASDPEPARSGPPPGMGGMGT